MKRILISTQISTTPTTTTTPTNNSNSKNKSKKGDDSNMHIDTNDNTTTASYTLTPEPDIAAGWVAVMQAIIPNLPPNMILLVYKTILPLLSIDQSISLQKRAYHILETLLKHHTSLLLNTAEARKNILNSVTDSIFSCHVSARNLRLRCLEVVLHSYDTTATNAANTDIHSNNSDSHDNNNNSNNSTATTATTTTNDNNTNDEELQSISYNILGEILLCLKDSNKKTRDSSMLVLKLLINKLSIQCILFQLCSAVAGETVTMRVAAITGMYICMFIECICITYNVCFCICGVLGVYNNIVYMTLYNDYLRCICVYIATFTHFIYSTYAYTLYYTSTHSLIHYNAGLCVLYLEKRSDLDLMAYIPNILDTICILLKEENVEETRVILSLLRTCVNVMPINMLLPLTPQFVTTFTIGLGTLKSKFTARIRAILRKLLQKVGEEAVRPYIPGEDIPLLDYILKQFRRTALHKQKKASAAYAYERTVLDRMLGSDSEDEEDDEDTDIYDTLTKSHRKADEEADRRLTRVKAHRPAEYKSTLPSTLADLIDEDNIKGAGSKHTAASNTTTNTTHNEHRPRKRAHTMTSLDDPQSGTGIANLSLAATSADPEDTEPYQVTVTAEGRVVVKAREISSQKDSDLNTPNPSDPTTQQGTGNKQSENPMAAENQGRYGNNALNPKKQRVIKEPGITYTL